MTERGREIRSAPRAGLDQTGADRPGAAGLLGPVVVTGTDTGVGKTVVTAAVAAAAVARDLRVAVLKPAQTGVGPGRDEESDTRTVARLAAPALVRTLACFPDPLAPGTAARVARRPPVELSDVVSAVRECDADLILIEGAGGLLVPMGPRWTIADLALALGAPAVVVVRAGLGTLNHTALTVEALRRRGVPSHLVIGAWPRRPELVHRTNVEDLGTLGPLVGAVPDGAGTLAPETFRAAAPGWLSARLHGAGGPPAV